MYHSQIFVITFEVTLETDAMERPMDQSFRTGRLKIRRHKFYKT